MNVKLELLTPDAWSTIQKKAISFAIRYGEKRLAVSTIHALRELDSTSLAADEHGIYNAVAVTAKLLDRTVGFGFASDGGEGGCMVVVHPEARGLGVGGLIMEAMLQRLGGLTCNVAADNVASMSLCFRMGMSAVSIHRGPTGKPTLRFERGVQHDAAHPRHSDLIPQ